LADALSIPLGDQSGSADAIGRLEACIERVLGDPEAARARDLMEAWRHGRLSQRNDSRDPTHDLPRRYVLVIDQAKDDPTVERAGADRRQFASMLRAAIAENPDSTIILWTPVVKGLSWRYRGYLPDAKQVLRITDDVHPARILELAKAVYAVASPLGFEALIWGKRVRTFGMPFYAGWSLTQDDMPAPADRHPVAIEQLIHGALVDHASYTDPETGAPCKVERIVEHLSLQRRMQERFPSVIHAVGFSKWKRPIVRQFFQGSRVDFTERMPKRGPGATVAIWGRGTDAEAAWPLLRIEDGFLRSVGLGAQLIAPLSWVIDRRGMYYDPSRPSDLEYILETAEISDALLQRAGRLREGIVASDITKYNLGAATWRRPATEKHVILVPGQVESDLSITYGAQSVRTNSGLLSAVRAENPDAYIVFKPHPDVLAGLRPSDPASAGDAACNEIVGSEASMAGMLREVDEVHTMTSLAGFEALLRGKRVVCHGQPFYAGWGLTDDRTQSPRRTRRLSLDMLVAGTLILYPTYVSRVTGQFTSPERVLLEIAEWRAAASSR
jgi:capsular polysaccharide export protein